MEKISANGVNKNLDSLSATGKPGARKLDREKMEKACADFESLFISQILKLMRQAVSPTGFPGNGPGKEIYQTLIDQELGKALAKRGGMGLGTMIYKQMIRQEERASLLPSEKKMIPSKEGNLAETREE
ncbi:MAG: hypothetical protein FJ117_17630 [Deltaproteobacteria bacterium]|nr:hypothetical protein [Deltaproteobacteria bacterium]